jgi:hypothetical protein
VLSVKQDADHHQDAFLEDDWCKQLHLASYYYIWNGPTNPLRFTRLPCQQNPLDRLPPKLVLPISYCRVMYYILQITKVSNPAPPASKKKGWYCIYAIFSAFHMHHSSQCPSVWFCQGYGGHDCYLGCRQIQWFGWWWCGGCLPSIVYRFNS